MKVKAAFVGFGEVNTPLKYITALSNGAKEEILKLGWELTSAEVVTDEPSLDGADRAIEVLRGADVEVLVLCITGWIPTHAVIRVADAFRHLPMILWGLTGWIEGETLVTTAPQAGTTALRLTLKNLGYRFRFVYSVQGKPAPLEALEAFGRAAHTVAALRTIRIGTMGYRDMQLYGTMFNGYAMRRQIGPEVLCFDFFEVTKAMESTGDAKEVAALVQHCRDSWESQNEVPEAALEQGVRYYLALKSLVKSYRFDALTLNDVDGFKKLAGFPPAMIFMLLEDVLKLPTMPENDVMSCAMKLIVRELTGKDAFYMEYYEFMEDRVLIGVPDYVPSFAVQGRVQVRATSFGLLKGSVLNVSRVKTGPVTLVTLFQDEAGRLTLHIATGQAVEPIQWEEAGWAPPAPRLPSLQVILDEPVAQFAQKVASQHAILVEGNVREALAQYAYLTSLEVV